MFLLRLLRLLRRKPNVRGLCSDSIRTGEMTRSKAGKPHPTQHADLDHARDDTFPASDPPSQTDPTHGLGAGPIAPTEDAVRQRAYEIWERAGSPHGRHDEHWERALRELESEGHGDQRE
jgi:hypothetical protein